MSLTGTNKLCQQCVNTCKQWAQVKVVICPYFRSNQKEKPEHEGKLKMDIPFNRSDGAKSARRGEISES